MSMQSTTRSGGDATGLPGGSLTRRSALQGSAAVAIALAAGITAAQSAAGAPDASLIDLARRLETLILAEREAWDRHSTAEDAVDQATPPAPIRREVAGPYAGLDALTTEQRLAKLFADPTDFWAASAAADAEHKAALAEHAKVVEAIERRHGVGRLEREARHASEKVAAASEKLAEMSASTLAGVASKALALLPIIGADWVARPAEIERHLALIQSLVEDAARLGTGRLA